jgi:hypothetical protein
MGLRPSALPRRPQLPLPSNPRKAPPLWVLRQPGPSQLLQPSRILRVSTSLQIPRPYSSPLLRFQPPSSANPSTLIRPSNLFSRSKVFRLSVRPRILEASKAFRTLSYQGPNYFKLLQASSSPKPSTSDSAPKPHSLPPFQPPRWAKLSKMVQRSNPSSHSRMFRSSVLPRISKVVKTSCLQRAYKEPNPCHLLRPLSRTHNPSSLTRNFKTLQALPRHLISSFSPLMLLLPPSSPRSLIS